MKRNSHLAWLVLFVLFLAGELELLLVSNYEIRTYVRALVHLPIYHGLLTLFTLGTIVLWLKPGQRDDFSPEVSLPRLLLHCLYYGGLLVLLPQLFRISQQANLWLATSSWLLAGLALVASWLAAWLPPKRWGFVWRRHQASLLWLGLLSVFVPWFAQNTAELWQNFPAVTFSAVQKLLYAFFDDPVSEPENSILGTTRFSVKIEPGCSGYEGIGLILVLMGFYLSLRHRDLKFPACLSLFPLGLAASWLANLARILLLIAIGSNWSPAVAVRGFHSQAGWVCFTVVGLSLIGLTEMGNWFRQDDAGVPKAWEIPGLPLLTPFLVLLIGTMLSQATSADFEYHYWLKVAPACWMLLHFWKSFRKHLEKPRLIAILAGLAAYGIWVIFAPQRASSPPGAFLQGNALVAWLLIRCLGSILVVPLAEELAFRGFLLRRLRSQDFEAVPWSPPSAMPILVSSAAFAIFHQEPLAAFLTGILFALTTTRPGHLGNAVLAHSLTNACICLEVLLSGHFNRW